MALGLPTATTNTTSVLDGGPHTVYMLYIIPYNVE